MFAEYIFLSVKRVLWNQELLICCIPLSLQWVVCALQPGGKAFYFCRFLEIKGPIYLQFLYYCRTVFFSSFTLKKMTAWAEGAFSYDIKRQISHSLLSEVYLLKSSEETSSG